MSGAIETEAPRPRPLSGGLWTLFSWLRRDERSSSESLSSAGSDRTAASFAFLAPGHYDTVSPAPLPPPGPPTDSYKKRVHDRNLRRQHDRDITLHRKYGLYGFGYDSLNLPHGRRATASVDRCERDRRAASESPRAHVPGKRRAPPPPIATTSLTRRRATKRRAPPPPIDLTHKIGEIANKDISNTDNKVPMNQSSLRGKSTQKQENATGCKPEKYSKKDESKEAKDGKLRHEKSFLKQIFDNRKRNSAIETSSVKFLPSISELDKQAAEIIEKYRLKEIPQPYGNNTMVNEQESPGSSKHQTETWICTRCLKKYNATVVTCNYCLPLNKVNDSFVGSKLSNNSTQTSVPLKEKSKAEDKEKLKEILKEMKDSLPKRPKNDNIAPVKSLKSKETEDYPKIVEASTLRIGSHTLVEEKQTSALTSNIPHLDKITRSSQIVTQVINNDQKQNNILSRNLVESIPEKVISLEFNPQVLHEKSESAKYLPILNSSEHGTSSNNNVSIQNKKELFPINYVQITQPVVLVHSKESNVVLNKTNVNKEELVKLISTNNDLVKSVIDNKTKNIYQKQIVNQNSDPKVSNITSKEKYDLNTPLKISSLLNPIYIPKNSTSFAQQTPTPRKAANINAQISTNPVNLTSYSPKLTATENKITIPILLPEKNDLQTTEPKMAVENNKLSSKEKVPLDEAKDIKPNNLAGKSNINMKLFEEKPSTSHGSNVDQHTRRRDLINQLEKSIAKGDEHAAAEAAVKLAQLRLSCSVLSFSSQIVAGPSKTAESQQNCSSKSVQEAKIKAEEVIQKSTEAITKTVKNIKEKEDRETQNKSTPNVDSTSNKETAPETLNEPTDTTKIGKSDIVSTTSASSNKNKSNNETNIAQLALPCKASTSKSIITKESVNEDVPILVWVEDKEATRGPVQIYVRRNAVMGDLRRQAEQSLGLETRMQRWIVGRSLCTDDNTPLVTLAGAALTAPFYLCLVESELNGSAKSTIDLKPNEKTGNVYNELVKLEHQPVVSNAETFECGVCIEECPPGGGVVLRECVHSFCRECLSDVVRHSEEPVVACPAMGCRGVLQEREIRGVVSPGDYEKWLARGLAAAESGTRNAFHCRTRDCTGWALCDPGVRRFPCPVCKRTNCVPCQAIHEGVTCEQHRVKLQQSAQAPDASQTDEGTRALLNTLISRGEALECPECSAIITKKWGCDWVKCSACKTEICWVTKGRRWGPAGRGDTSGGCRCGLDGKRCHPSCGYCH